MGLKNYLGSVIAKFKSSPAKKRYFRLLTTIGIFALMIVTIIQVKIKQDIRTKAKDMTIE